MRRGRGRAGKGRWGQGEGAWAKGMEGGHAHHARARWSACTLAGPGHARPPQAPPRRSPGQWSEQVGGWGLGLAKSQAWRGGGGGWAGGWERGRVGWVGEPGGRAPHIGRRAAGGLLRKQAAHAGARAVTRRSQPEAASHSRCAAPCGASSSPSSCASARRAAGRGGRGAAGVGRGAASKGRGGHRIQGLEQPLAQTKQQPTGRCTAAGGSRVQRAAGIGRARAAPSGAAMPTERAPSRGAPALTTHTISSFSHSLRLSSQGLSCRGWWGQVEGRGSGGGGGDPGDGPPREGHRELRAERAGGGHLALGGQRCAPPPQPAPRPSLPRRSLRDPPLPPAHLQAHVPVQAELVGHPARVHVALHLDCGGGGGRGGRG